MLFRNVFVNKLSENQSYIMIPRIKLKYIFFSLIIVAILKYFGVFTHIFEKDFYSDFHYPYDGDIQESVQQLRHNVTPDIKPINMYEYIYMTNCDHKCKSDEKLIMPRLVYIVKSALEHFDRRIAIRNSWGFENRFSDVIIRTIFLVGVSDNTNLQNKINAEYEKYHDIVQANFYDTYFNNTIKTMMGFKWAVQFCPNSKFYIFVDDDMYVSTKNVLRFIRNPTNYPRYLKEPINIKSKPPWMRSKRQVMDFELPDDVQLYAGYVFISSPHRHKTSKWHVSLEEYPYNMWPPYVTAGSFILSRESLHEMYYTSFYTKHFRFDDIYLGLVALKANIEPYHCNEFHFYKKDYDLFDYTYVISSHGYDNPQELLRVWDEQRSAGNA